MEWGSSQRDKKAHVPASVIDTNLQGCSRRTCHESPCFPPSFVFRFRVRVVNAHPNTMGFLQTLTLSRPKDVAGKTWPAIAVGMFVAFGGVLFGCASSFAEIRFIRPISS